MIGDLGSEKEVDVEGYIGRIKVIKSISMRIIDFLAQIEDFQKKLFEKKKFVLKSEYCLTLDQVPREFYSEIVKNSNQILAWKDLFGIGNESSQTTLIVGKAFNEEFLENHPFLVLDTKFSLKILKIDCFPLLAT